MNYDLTLAGPEGDAAAATRGSSGVFYELGAEADAKLRQHPVAVAELGRPRGFDHIHLSLIDGTDFISWMGRRASGFHKQIGRTMRLIKLPSNDDLVKKT